MTFFLSSFASQIAFFIFPSSCKTLTSLHFTRRMFCAPLEHVYFRFFSLFQSIFLRPVPTAKLQWQRTQGKMLASKKPFGVDLTSLKSPVEEKKIIEIAMKFAFQIDSIILNLYTGSLSSLFANDSLKRFPFPPTQPRTKVSPASVSIIFHSTVRI
jgi:hypothetical protein